MFFGEKQKIEFTLCFICKTSSQKKKIPNEIIVLSSIIYYIVTSTLEVQIIEIIVLSYPI